MPTKKTDYKPPKNDKLSKALIDIVPKEYRGTNQFLDIVAWNVRYFHDRDPQRVNNVASVLAELNADIFVFEEILDGSLEVVAEKLKSAGAGNYKTAYGKTGGDQRVAMMYDLDWIRAKDDIGELFSKNQFKVDGKDAFPRLPLRAYFTGLAQGDVEPFDFQLLGLHLKSQRGEADSTSKQRAKSADALRGWLLGDAQKVDSDVIMMGDWNEPPDAAAWAPFRDMETKGQVLFHALNDTGCISHLMYKNKNEIGSRLDLGAVTVSSAKEMVNRRADVVQWKSLSDLLKGNPKAAQVKAYISQISNDLSDHMPIVMRFYFQKK
jgi:endonuclease/exonuclease/phosphatase family metal-dependent hydrolase